MPASQDCGCQEDMTEFNKNSDSHTRAYYGVNHLLQMFRLTGCCPIDGLRHRRLKDLKIRFRGWYSLYSCVCILLAIATLVEVIFDSGSRRNLEAKSNIVVSVIFAMQSTVNFALMMLQSSRFIFLLRQCAMFESRRPASKRFVRKMRCLMVAVVTCCLVFFTSLLSRRIYRTAVAHGVLEFCLRLSVSVGALYILFWSTIAEWTLVAVAHLLRGYLEEVIKDFRAYEASMARCKLGHQWAFLRKIRQDVRTIKIIKKTANDTIQLGVLVTYAAIMTYSCCSAFYVITTESSVELLMKVMAVGSVVRTFLTITSTTLSSQAFTDKIQELKECIENFGTMELPRKLAKLLLTFQLCLDVDCFAFNACGFFSVEPAIFKAMFGVVITYTLILYQTKLTGVSVHSTECSNLDNLTTYSTPKSLWVY